MRLTCKHFLSIFAFFVFLTPTKLISQNKSSLKWTAKFEYQKAFIENRGQFSIPNSFGNPSEVLYAVDHGGTKIYFTKKGVTYSLLEATKTPNDERENDENYREVFINAEEHALHELEEHKLNVKSDQVTMLWQNANDNVQIEAMGLTGDYHNYSIKQPSGDLKNVSYIKGYKKITYKNIYPNIDIEYVFAEKGGLKYSLILHPGANPSQVKMVYDNNVSLLNNGEIHIETKFGDIIDHAPLTFYENNSSSVISSNFIKSGKTVSFQLDNYDNTKSVVIDPWTQTPAFNSNWDCVWECENDAAGNVYIIGGVMPLQLIKYNAAGTLQWTYNTPYDTTSWLGTFATDDLGNSYVTRGSVSGIQKISAAGVLVWNSNGSGTLGNSDEYWNIAFNCDQTKLIVGGTTGAFGLPPVLKGAIFDINTANGTILATKTVAYGATFPLPSIQEVRSITSCGNGRYYFLTLDSIGYINQNFNLCGPNNSAIFKTTSTHGFGYKCENFRRDNTGIMGIRADLNFVYTHNGTTLFKRSLANASIIASVSIPGGASSSSLGKSQVSCSGIDIDASGNIYVGSTNAVTKFSPALVQLGTVSVPFNVYDVHVSAGGDIIACGSTGNSGSASRTGYIQSISSLSASGMLALTCCDINICQPPNVCSTASAFNLQAATPGGTWSGTGITNTTNGTFNPATAGIGTHVITYSLACGVGSVSVNVLSCGTVTLCLNGSSLNVGGGSGTYTLASTSTSLNCSACPGGNCIPFVCAGVQAPIWTASGSSVAAPTSTVFPIKITDTGTGTTFTFTSLASIPTCSTPTCPTLTLAVSSQTNVNCFGASTGSASISTSGGTGPYTYTWSPGNLSGASQTGLSAGIYTISIRDANACTGSGTLSITQPTSAVTAVISSTTNTGCGISTGGATVTAGGGTPGYTYSWSPGGSTTTSASNLGAGNNSVTVTDSKGCSSTAVAIITSAGGPTLNVVSQNSITCFGANTGTATVGASGSGPFSYTWTPGNLTGASQTNLSAGTYTINLSDANLCSGSGTLTIIQPTAALNAVISSTAATSCGLSVGGATVVPSGGTPGYTYSWSPNGATTANVTNLAVGNNTVTVTDSKGCTVDAIAVISSIGGPTLSIASFQNVNCFGTNTGTATVIAGGGTGPYSYTWTPGNLSGAAQTNLSAGVYTVAIKDAGQCLGTGTVSITQPTAAVSGIISNTIAPGCGLTNGSASVTASGGTPSYTYSWNPTGGTGSSASNLPAGTNAVTITDSKGCSITVNVSLNSIGGPIISVASQSNTTCYGGANGSASVSVSGTGSYSYTWSPNGGNTANASGLTAGIYTVNVVDGAGCISIKTISISQPPVITLSINTTPANCGDSNGTATINASGGTGSLGILWETGSTSNSITGLTAGSYSVIVTDANSCSSTGTAVVITTGGLAVDAGLGTTIVSGESTAITANVPNGATVVWSPSGSLSCSNCTSTIASPTITTTYTVTADLNGCIGSDTVTIFVEIFCGNLYVPTAFSPNNDGQNDVLYVMGNCITFLEFVIFDRWGEKVFESSNPNFGWDGTFNGKPLNPAMFAYYLNAIIDGEPVKKYGNISIIK